MLEVFLSNPEYLEWTEGGDYDLEKLNMDWSMAGKVPGRHMLGLREKASGEIVGVIEYIEDNAQDGHPWIGLIMVRAERQREGLAGEAMSAVMDLVFVNWAQPIRLAVIEQNTAGRALAISLGFEPYGEADHPTATGFAPVVLLQRRL